MDKKSTQTNKGSLAHGEVAVKSGMDAPIYNVSGKKTGNINLPDAVFAVPWNDSIIRQVVTSMQSNARPSVAHTKGRGDVRGGGRKPWQQKGTGRARHGSSRSPIWKGGGVTHGPLKQKNYMRTIPRKMRAKALSIALSQKYRDGGILFVDSFAFKTPKTAEAVKTLTLLAGISGFEKMVVKKRNAALIAVPAVSDAAKKSFRNIGAIDFMDVASLNPVVILKNTYLIIENPELALPIITKRFPSSKLKVKN